MQTIKLQVEDSLYNDIVDKGINIQEEFKLLLHRLIYTKEYRIADDINKSMEDIKQGKSRPISELLSEV